MSLKAKNAAAVANLLNEHEMLTDSIARLGKRSYDFGITVTNEKDDRDFVSVSLDRTVARHALKAQRKLVEKQLSALGIEVER
jgi:hypothetical protein